LVERLLRDFPDALVLRVLWSGLNSVSARSAASRYLSELLRNSLTNYAGAPHVVIAHSHGGNVALKAIDNSDLREVRVVCLSTPILYMVPRKALTESAAFHWIAFITGLCLGIFADHKLTPNHCWIITGRWLDFLIQLAIWAPVILGLLIALTTYEERAQVVSKDVNIDHFPNPRNVIFLRYVSDEASGFLSFFSFLQYLQSRIVQIVVKLASGAAKIGKWGFENWLGLMIVCFIWGVSVGFIGDWLTGTPSTAPWLGRVAFVALTPIVIFMMIPFAALAASLVLLFVLIPICILLICAGVLPFGFELAALAVWFEIDVEAAPPGQWRITSLIPLGSANNGLRHSFSHDEKAAIEAIIKEIKQMNTDNVFPASIQAAHNKSDAAALGL
jgi:hypothetical protein